MIVSFALVALLALTLFGLLFFLALSYRERSTFSLGYWIIVGIDLCVLSALLYMLGAMRPLIVH